MSAFFICDNKEILDQAAFDRYAAEAPATVAAFGGFYRVINGQKIVMEGDQEPKFPVIIEFPSLDKARAWYNSDLYKEMKALRLGASNGSMVLIEGFKRPPAIVRFFAKLMGRPIPF